MMQRRENGQKLKSVPNFVTPFVWRVRRHLGVGDLRCLQQLCGDGVQEDVISELLRELALSEVLARSSESPAGSVSSSEQRKVDSPQQLLCRLDLEGPGRGRALFLYTCVRLLQPDVVVETGCFTGWDSALVLQALERNGHGHLYSIDLPAVEGRFSQVGPRSSLPEGMPIGFLVPESLKDRWTLIVGDVRDELLPLLRRVGKVDIFYHDSHHAYEHMMWEFTTVWPLLRTAGLLISDDIAWNAAIRDFARGVHRTVVIHRRSPNLGALVK